MHQACQLTTASLRQQIAGFEAAQSVVQGTVAPSEGGHMQVTPSTDIENVAPVARTTAPVRCRSYAAMCNASSGLHLAEHISLAGRADTPSGSDEWLPRIDVHGRRRHIGAQLPSFQ